MIDPKLIFEVEQSSECIGEILENMNKVLSSRFDEQHSWELVKIIAFALYGGKVVL